MDEDNKPTEDLVVGSDGSINEESAETTDPGIESAASAQTIEVKTEDAGAAEVAAETVDIAQLDPEESVPAGMHIEVKQPPAEEPVEESVDVSPPPESIAETVQSELSAEPGPATDDTGADTVSSDSGLIEPGSSLDVESEPAAASLPARPEHHNNKVLAVAVTILVAVLLAAGAVYMYMSAQSNTKETDKSGEQTTAEQDEPVEADEAAETVPASDEDQVSIREDVAKLLSAVGTYTANNNGRSPAATDIDSTFITQYLDGAFNDQSTGNPYGIVETDPGPGQMQYKTGSTCDSDNMIVAGSSREVAVRALLGDGTYYCLAN